MTTERPAWNVRSLLQRADKTEPPAMAEVKPLRSWDSVAAQVRIGVSLGLLKFECGVFITDGARGARHRLVDAGHALHVARVAPRSPR